MEEYYIEYLKAFNNKPHERRRIEFFTYEGACNWGRKNLDNFTSEMVKQY